MSGKARAFCFTINNYSEDALTKLNELECSYLVYGKELAPSTGTPHLQGYVHFKNPRSLVAVRKLLNGHVTIANGTPQQNFDYCSKDGDYIERGTRPSDSAAAGRTEAARWDEAKQAALEGRWTDIPTDLFVRYGNGFKRLKLDLAPKPKPLDNAEYYGIWLYGPTGTGKSYWAYENYPDAYVKEPDQWFCNYMGEDQVVIHEWSPEISLTQKLKTWADRWPFPANRKHASAILIRPKLIVITSNYRLEECFGGRDLDPMKRRFKEITLEEKYSNSD